MTAYAKFVGSWVRAHFGANDAGQNMVETALIIGVITLVIVFAFSMTNISAAMANLANQVACEVTGDTWTPPAAGTAAAGTCA